MLSSVLRSPRAVQVNIAIMRAFVKLRGLLASHRDLARRLDKIESKYDAQFKVVFDAIRRLMTPPEKPRHRMALPRRTAVDGRRIGQSDASLIRHVFSGRIPRVSGARPGATGMGGESRRRLGKRRSGWLLWVRDARRSGWDGRLQGG